MTNTQRSAPGRLLYLLVLQYAAAPGCCVSCRFLLLAVLVQQLWWLLLVGGIGGVTGDPSERLVGVSTAERLCVVGRMGGKQQDGVNWMYGAVDGRL